MKTKKTKVDIKNVIHNSYFKVLTLAISWSAGGIQISRLVI